jgi:hypothetical protein
MELKTMQYKLLIAAAILGGFLVGQHHAHSASPATNLAKIGADFASYQEYCHRSVSVSAWDTVLAGIEKYGKDVQAMQDEILRNKRDYLKDSTSFCNAMSASVDVMVQGLATIQ